MLALTALRILEATLPTVLTAIKATEITASIIEILTTHLTETTAITKGINLITTAIVQAALATPVTLDIQYLTEEPVASLAPAVVLVAIIVLALAAEETAATVDHQEVLHAAFINHRSLSVTTQIVGDGRA